MPNIIQPTIESPPVQNDSIPAEVLDAGLSIKNAEVMQYLGLSDYDSRTMEKVSALADYFPNIDDLMEADLKLGQRMDMTRLDKIYSYVLLLRQEEELVRKQDLINNAKRQWEAKPMPHQI